LKFDLREQKSKWIPSPGSKGTDLIKGKDKLAINSRELSFSFLMKKLHRKMGQIN